MSVLRSWLCQNARCGAAFDAWDNYPSCPQCGCNRCNWLPAGGHIGGMAKKSDAIFRDLVDAYGMTNAVEGRAGERAMPSNTAAVHDRGGMVQFAPGFVATPYVRDANGNARAVCMPSAAAVDFKVKAPVGQRLTPQSGLPGPRSNTRVEGVFKG